MQLGQTLTLRAAFASSTYLLPQIPGPGRSSDDDLLNSRIIQTYFFRGHPLSKGAIRAYGLSIAAGPSLPASSGPASDDALLILRSVLFRHVVRLVPQTTTMCAAFASSTYLLPQIPGPACLNPPNPLFKGAHQASVRTGGHGHRFAVLRPASEAALAAFRTLLLRFV